MDRRMGLLRSPEQGLMRAIDAVFQSIILGQIMMQHVGES